MTCSREIPSSDFNVRYIAYNIRWMSLGKHQSVTSDTRATGSLNYSMHGQPKLAKQVINS